MRQQARAFIPPEVRPNPAATQTLIQPLSPPDLAPPPVPLPNFRVLADLSQIRKIPKPFEAPGRRTPPTPAQAPDVTAPALELVPLAPAPVGDPLSVFSLNDRPIPFNEKVVVPPGNVAQPPLESTGPPGVSGSATAANAAGNGTARAAGAAGNAASANPSAGNGNGSTNSASNALEPGNGRGSVGNGTGSALVGGGTEGSPVAIVGGNGASPGSAGSSGAGSGAGGSGALGAGTSGSGGNSDSAGIGTGAGAGAGTGTGVGTGTGAGAGTGSGAGSGAGRTTPGSPTINRPPTGNFDAVVVQSSPVDQYPESRGLLSGRPIYSVYIPMGAARDWTLFFCVPGEKPESASGPVVRLGPLGAPVKAPYPTKLIKPLITLPSYEKYVLVRGTVNQQGKFESLRLVRPIKPETDQALLAALSAWEFRAATRDGVAIVVEFLLSIPAKGL